MREFLIGKNSGNSGNGKRVTCEYTVVIHDECEDLPCEYYGIRITLVETGEMEEIRDITMSADQIFEIGELLMKNTVTPCTHQDVIADWL